VDGPAALAAIRRRLADDPPLKPRYPRTLGKPFECENRGPCVPARPSGTARTAVLTEGRGGLVRAPDLYRYSDDVAPNSNRRAVSPRTIDGDARGPRLRMLAQLPRELRSPLIRRHYKPTPARGGLAGGDALALLYLQGVPGRILSQGLVR
jgi:hypothetical protein